jgi:hypothetical protein
MGLDGDVVGGHGSLALDDPEPGLDVREPGRVGRDLVLEFGLAQFEHAAQFLGGDVLVGDLLHLLQGETEFLQRDDAVEPRELSGRMDRYPLDGSTCAGRSSPIAS